ncbi:MAG: hypothetical protein OHK0046_39590 [Anaerolineae bacterium]
MTETLLQQIQTLQFHDKPAAESLLKAFIRETFPTLDVHHVELRPQAVSLNSFNGFLTLADGGHLFFKTHTEQDNVIDEYYNAAMLAQAGYPVIQPLYSSTRAGQHLLIYEVITDPSVFDVAWAIEQGEGNDSAALTQAQHAADDALLQCYFSTWAEQSASEAAAAPIHQLFYHRLVGGRLARFYSPDVQVTLPNGTYTMQQVRHWQWDINGKRYHQSLDDLIGQAVHVLKPEQKGPSVIGHGDAHNGNVFFQRDERSLLYFDPAFAGRHHPLLDITKPLFHNVFAMWMYFPQVKHQQTHMNMRLDGDTLYVEHDYHIHPIREMFLRSKVERVLRPMLAALAEREHLRADWRTYLKSALFCCPFLTLNLADSTRFSPEISLLGLSMAVEMGADHPQSMIDQVLTEVAP